MASIFVSLLAFAALFFAVFAANAVLVDIYSGERRRIKMRLDEQFRISQRQRLSSLAKGHKLDVDDEAFWEQRQHRSLHERLDFMVEQSGLRITVAKLVRISVSAAVVVGALFGWLSGSIVLGLVLAALSAAAPFLYVQWKRQRHLDKMLSQLPDAFDLMSRVMKAGQTVSQAMQSVGEELSKPISHEFINCYEQMNLGLSAEAALRELSRRTGLLEIKIFVLALLVHRQTGGNLADLLENLAKVVRERFRIKGMIRSLTAQGRFQAGILLSLPPLMFLLLMIVHPDYESTLLHFPGMIAMALGMMAAGALWIRRIVSFEF